MRAGLTMVLMVLALGLSACASAPDDRSPGSRSDAQMREQARRDLERECRLANMQGRYDSRCPQPESRVPPEQDPLRLPPARVPLD